MMDDRVSDLLGIIQEEIFIARDLLENARLKTELFIQVRVDAILEANKNDETLNHALRFLERKRVNVCRALASAFGIPPERIAPNELAGLIDHPLAPEISRRTNMLKSIMADFRSVNEHNLRLID
ncbi:MAG TPA: flagellar export chaperone FlgN, partial [Acidobacteriota bacterium]|nr:flagellar export chaperone FlgN [Acidobacteriota bacterium]